MQPVAHGDQACNGLQLHAQLRLWEHGIDRRCRVDRRRDNIGSVDRSLLYVGKAAFVDRSVLRTDDALECLALFEQNTRVGSVEKPSN